MGRADHLELGQWNFNCSLCGKKLKSSEGIKHWQGQWRCQDCFELRQPQDFVRGVPDAQTPPWTQIAGTSFVTTCSPNGRSALPDCGAPDCMLPDFIDPAFDPAATS